MSLVDATPQEIAMVQKALGELRTELMRHADKGVQTAGFQNDDTRALACMSLLIGAAQRYALQSRQHYAIFRSLCADMAASEADAVIQRAAFETGPETAYAEEQITEGGIILPPGSSVQ